MTYRFLTLDFSISPWVLTLVRIKRKSDRVELVMKPSLILVDLVWNDPYASGIDCDTVLNYCCSTSNTALTMYCLSFYMSNCSI